MLLRDPAEFAPPRSCPESPQLMWLWRESHSQRSVFGRIKADVLAGAGRVVGVYNGEHGPVLFYLLLDDRRGDPVTGGCQPERGT